MDAHASPPVAADPEIAPMKDKRRAANIRTGLLLAALALGFYLFIIIRYKVLGA